MIVSILLNTLWQGALVVGLTALVLRFVPVRNATTRYAVWFVTALSLAAVPLLTTLLHWHLPMAAAIAHRAGFGRPAFSLTALGPLEEPSSNIALALGALWIAGSALALVRLAISYARITRIRHRAGEIFRAGTIPVLASADLSVPIAAGILSPAILIPREVLDSLPRADLECTIEHELAHVRRHDVLTNAVERILEALFFWNPWLHFAGRRLATEREAACDDWAVQRLGEPNRYANCLAQLGRRLRSAATPILTPSAFGSRHSLVARIERLMADRSPSENKFNYAAVGGITMLVAVLTLVLQTIVPAPAQATGFSANAGAAVAAACKNPNAEPQALNPAMPDLPKSEVPPRKVSAVMTVTVAANGKPVSVLIYRSSGYPNVDRAVAIAAEHSTYSPKLVNCVPTEGKYLFRADFAP